MQALVPHEKALMPPLAAASSENMEVTAHIPTSVAKQGDSEILLVDEVDVFFSPSFYGKTHNQIAPLHSQDVEELLRLVWRHREKASNVEELIEVVLHCDYYKALLHKYPDFTEIVQSEALQMCFDLQGHLQDPNYVAVGNRIGYKMLDGIAFNVVMGYKTAFAYLQEAAKQSLSDEEATLRKNLIMRIPCGRFSYANFGSAKILGVSGTIEALGDYEWEVMHQFGIRSYTVLPSVYGDNQNFTFLGSEHEPIMISKDANYFRDITEEVQ